MSNCESTCMQVQEWACSLCIPGWSSLTCGGTSTSASRWLWSSLGFSPRQQWREPRPQSSVLWSRAWRARVEGTSGTYSSFYELLSCCFLLANNMCSLTEHSFNCSTVYNLNYLSLCMLSDCAATRCSRAASDDNLAQKLWEISCNMLGITWQWTVATKPCSERCAFIEAFMFMLLVWKNIPILWLNEQYSLKVSGSRWRALERMETYIFSQNVFIVKVSHSTLSRLFAVKLFCVFL